MTKAPGGGGGDAAPGEGTARVRVPASSAYLGPGYDSFGLALGIYDEVTAARTASGLAIHVTGAGADSVPTDETHLVARAARAAFEQMVEPMPGLTLRCVNAIPHGSGQGSSASAIVAGILAARALTRDGARRLPDDAVLALATRLEGHPDNVAPALLGGCTIAWRPGDRPVGADAQQAAGTGQVRAVRLEPHPAVRAILFDAAGACSTSAARAAVPASVPHADAAANAARAGLLVHAITTDPSLLFDATEDLLHQQYRTAVMPDSLALLRRLRGLRLAAVLSGAGPSVLALGVDLPDPESLDDTGFRPRLVPLSAVGARVETA